MSNLAPPGFKHWPLPKDMLDLMRAYRDSMMSAREEIIALNKETQERALVIQNAHMAEMMELWRRMSASVGLSHEETWGDYQYGIEARYIEDGFAAITYLPQQAHPLAGMLPGEQPEEPAKGRPKVDPRKLN